MTADQAALAAWFAQSRWTVEQERRWLRKAYNVRAVCYLTNAQAQEALARLRRDAA